jgi:hypothetical protein
MVGCAVLALPESLAAGGLRRRGEDSLTDAGAEAVDDAATGEGSESKWTRRPSGVSADALKDQNDTRTFTGQ